MGVEDERPTVAETPSSSPVLGNARSPSKEPDSSNVKVVPLSELSNIFTNGLPKETPEPTEKDSEDDVSLNLSPSPQLNLSPSPHPIDGDKLDRQDSVENGADDFNESSKNKKTESASEKQIAGGKSVLKV